MLKMSDKIKNFIQNECSNWTKFEVIWLLFSTLVIIGISIKLRDNTMGIIASLCAIWYSLLAGKGKLSCYLFGIINTVLYGYISYKHGKCKCHNAFPRSTRCHIL